MIFAVASGLMPPLLLLVLGLLNTASLLLASYRHGMLAIDRGDMALLAGLSVAYVLFDMLLILFGAGEEGLSIDAYVALSRLIRGSYALFLIHIIQRASMRQSLAEATEEELKKWNGI